MSEHTTVVTEQETPEAFLADRQRFWTSFTHFVLATLAGVLLILIGLAVLVY
jgi:hypothetical protein